jgi:hypothetical protein
MAHDLYEHPNLCQSILEKALFVILKNTEGVFIEHQGTKYVVCRIDGHPTGKRIIIADGEVYPNFQNNSMVWMHLEENDHATH